MTMGQQRQTREAALKKLENSIAENNSSVAIRFERACLLAALGRTEEAKQAYLSILSLDPLHLDTLKNFGALLYETGYKSAAETVYRQAVMHHPLNAASHVNLANLLFEDGKLPEARRHYEEALHIEPGLPEAHQGLTRIFSTLRDEAGVQRHRIRGFQDRAVTVLPYLGDAEPVDLLLLVAAEGGNIPLRQHIDNRVFRITVVYADFYDPRLPLPPHHLVFNGIGDADLCEDALRMAAELVKKTTAPVINPPEKITGTGRLDNARRLTGLAGVKTPETQLITKTDIVRKQQELRTPLLLRAPGFHTGQHFVKLNGLSGVAAALAQLPGNDILAMQYLDARAADGYARKYRVMMIGGKLYPLHLAVSQDWKVHYFTAAMAGQPQFQAEEKRFLEDMPAVLGPQGMAALESIKDRLGLDYGGIDFGLDAEGNILMFEANATMVINPPPPEEQWDYRRAPIARALQAVRDLLKRDILKQGGL